MATELLEAIRHHELRELDLSRNQLHDGVCKALAETLAPMGSLRRLDLSWNRLHDPSALCAWLETRDCALKELVLGYNSLGAPAAQGVLRLGHAVRANATLELLDISFNRIGSEGNRRYTCRGQPQSESCVEFTTALPRHVTGLLQGNL